jgi:hypothetical protein
MRRRTHIDLGSESERSCATVGVKVENHALTLTDHAKHGTVKRVLSEIELAEICVCEDDAITRAWIVGLDHALHGGNWPDQRAVGAGEPALTTLPALMHPVQTARRFGLPLTIARIFWMLGFQRRLVRRWE